MDEHNSSPFRDTSDDVPTTSKSGRGPTRLKKVSQVVVTTGGIDVNLDPETGVAYGPNAEIFNSYLGVLARDRISILVPSWDHVQEPEKDALWNDVMTHFRFQSSPVLKAKTLSSIATKFRQFKSKLTSTYIYGSKQGKSPCEIYPLIDQQTWETFVHQRLSDEWKVKRRKAQETQSKNDTPHILSRGGYKRLEENIMKEKEAALADIPDAEPPSPPSRHEKWKKARVRSSGAYTSDASRLVAEKIDSLVEESTQGTYRPHGREDILVSATGRSEHPGRVRAVGHGVGIRSYFGAAQSSSSSSGYHSQESIDELREKITQDVRQSLIHEVRQQVTDEVTARLIREFEERLSSYGLSQQRPPMTDAYEHVPPATGISTKGSSPAAYTSFAMPTTYPSDATCRQKRSLAPGADPLQALNEIARDFMTSPMEIPWDFAVFYRRSDVPLYIYMADMLEVSVGEQYLNISVIQLWCKYLTGLINDSSTSDVYGIIDPQLTQILGNRPHEIQGYVTNVLVNSGKRIFFAPCIHESHWQLLVISLSDHTATWFCSLHKKPNSQLKKIIDSAYASYNMMMGRPPSQATMLDWIILKPNKQRGGYECGYYVMQWMASIINQGIAHNWEENFFDRTPFTQEALDYVRRTWASYLINLYNNVL